MDILDRITLLLNGRDQKTLTDYLKLNSVAFSEWKSGKSKSYRKYLIEIAEFFGVSLDYLVYGKESAAVVYAENDTLSGEERELLEYYSGLRDIYKGMVLGEAKALCELEKRAKVKVPSNPDISSQNRAKKTIFIDYFSLPVSAGTGVYLDSSESEMLEVEENDLTREANYAVRISGNSMEPKFHDGDIVLVESMPEILIGEIGVFILNGEGFIKKLGKGCLISLNPDYDPIKFEDGDEIWCKGRVIGVI